MGGTYQRLERYIEDYWDKLLITETVESKTALGLPNPYYAPSTEVAEGFSFPHMYYWDNYFIIQGLWGTEREGDIIGVIDNMFDLIRRFGFVPNSNSFSHLSRSQAPLLAPLVIQAIEKLNIDDELWIENAYNRLSEEYWTVWLGTAQPHNRVVFKGLSRYYDSNVLHVLAEAESGWDFTTRFDDHCLNFLPVDLNSYLYLYETCLMSLAERLNKTDDSTEWQQLSLERKDNINELMWHIEDSFFYDFDFKKMQQGRVKSLAAYASMFSGLASEEQAAQLVNNLKWFETDHGLSTTALSGISYPGKQWACPNGWAPLHDLVVDGLDRYGFNDDAQRIRQKWVDTVANNYERTGNLDEKYDVVDPALDGGNGVYPSQHGFGWTNGVTYKFLKQL